MKKTTVAGLGVCAVALAFAAKDPVIMTVNGEDVPKSEFEYLYNKNSQQQINPQTLDEYVEMFKLYKMKVAEAKAEGLDTMASFLKEAEQYRHDLAAPYLADSVYLNSLVKDAYDLSNQEVEAYHIMLFKTRDNSQNAILRQRADSLHGVLVAGGDFAELAGKYSQDGGSSKRGGRMGWITANRYPYTFEQTAFTLPEGAISEVIESPQGYHILKGGKHRPARGSVHAAHIMKMTSGMDAEAKAKARQEIDSLYQIVIANPEFFGKIAFENSDDKNSGRNGGMLNWFSAGEMVEPFDSVAFSLKDGEISKPVETVYGYHIIRRVDHKAPPTLNEIKPGLLQRFSSPQDPRYQMIRDHQTARFAKKHKAKLNDKTLALMREDLKNGALDSLYLANWTTMPKADMPIATVDGKTTSAGKFAATLKPRKDLSGKEAQEVFDNRLADFYNSILSEAEEMSLSETEPDYRNLLKEYVDGSLLYEVSVRKVWDRAAQDTEGLKDYFNRNRESFRWTEPHVKGFLVQAANDSVADLIKARAIEVAPENLVATVREEFKGNAQIDKVLVGKGSNAIVDYLVFGGPEVKSPNSKYTVCFMINDRLLDEPEEVEDVKGLVTSAYQNELQEQWESQLRNKYSVSVNDKVLREIKK